MLFKVCTAVALVAASAMVKASPTPAPISDLEALTGRATPLAQVITKCTVPNNVALTFDDGPEEYIYNISRQLIAAGGKGTFFWNGNNYGCIYDEINVKRVKYAYAQGHMVASHTWDHKDLTTLTFDEIHDEFYRVELALERLLGVKPAFLRPPYGNYNNLVRQVAYERGQKLVTWDFDSGDSTGSTPAQSDAAYDALIKKHPSTILALNHEVYEKTAHIVVPHAIAALKKAGYELVTVAECIGLKPYQSVTSPQTGSWTC
ncbi:carbohydrate esterase family 4 protein [Piloderma croceum F 1598]|uniref:Carbohydrate esterase family 4 protein n=1 Tax=Piloderma croceum (strain F 1598) TaxID=765440 RepID=A0A0C3C939_PILCF|nr:carbohydrate esterase family 4 protein [Piloderma croceum F 1598]